MTLISTTSWQRMSGVVLGIATGTFVYIAIYDLLPDILRDPDLGSSRTQAALGLIAGIALSVLECVI